ncbi:MAG: hypothetical protein H7Y86_17155 [Rhizobacter sp.]|nr:hypothetical protein [Ferruginibacter sp.]
MKKTLNVLLFGTAIILLAACSKNDDDSSNCEAGNYGVLKVNFGVSNVKHGILVSYPGGSARDKIVAIGKASDTVRLFPGTYPIEIASINNSNQAIETETITVNITVCEDKETSVTF